MMVLTAINELNAQRQADANASWGLVPTMGYLHNGHLSLIRRARVDNGKVVASIFVNPTQFSPSEDLASYPRDLERDLALLRQEDVDIVFVPSEDELYPEGFQTSVIVSEAARPLEGASRPTHFQGVATIVAKLLNIARPTRVYFGQKDAQQCVVIRQMLNDLNFDLEMVVCPIVREADGLAMSSRNYYLSPEERQSATVLFRSLSAAQSTFIQGERDGQMLRSLMAKIISTEPLAQIDYVSAADPNTLRELDRINDSVLLSTAVYFGQTRLIDNILIAAN